MNVKLISIGGDDITGTANELMNILSEAVGCDVLEYGFAETMTYLQRNQLGDMDLYNIVMDRYLDGEQLMICSVDPRSKIGLNEVNLIVDYLDDVDTIKNII